MISTEPRVIPFPVLKPTPSLCRMNESSSAIFADLAKFPGPMRYSVFAPSSTTTHHSGVLFAERHQVIMEAASQSKEIAFHCDMDAAAGRTIKSEMSNHQHLASQGTQTFDIV